MTLRDTILAAARAESIPEGASGLWHIKKIRLARTITAPKDGKFVTVPAGEYTQLWR